MSRFRLSALACAAVLAFLLVVPAAGQTLTTGILEGIVTDQQSTPIADAVVTIQGPQGVRTVTTDAGGRYQVRDLPPGEYTVRAESSGFSTVVQTEVQLAINKRTQLSFALPKGIEETVTVTSQAPVVDMKSTTVGTNVSVDEFVEYIPLGRNFAQMFTLSPGVVSGGQSGAGNFSVSGSSGLENSYLVDGVNITNSGYGGIGSYNRVFGSLGSGVTNDFIDQVEVKTGGFEAEFGQATGGVMNAVVKSGTNELSGQVALYAQPSSFESNRRQESITPDAVPTLETQQTDLGLSLGGPAIKDKLFWFAAYNPVKTEDKIIRIVEDESALYIPGTDTPYDPDQTTGGRVETRERQNNNYAAKVSWYLNPNHRLEFTAFGDPSTGDYGPQRPTSLRRTGTEGFSELDYGGNNYSLKYGGALNGNFYVDAMVARHESNLTEEALDLYNIFNLNIPGGLSQGGLGFKPDTDETVDQLALKLTYIWGDHEIRGGFQQDDIEYTEAGRQTGPTWTAMLPIAERDAEGLPRWTGEYFDFQSTTGAFLELDGDIYNVSRSRFSPVEVLTSNTETNFFIQDTWSITPRWTLNAGVRYTKEEVSGGSPFSLPFSVVRASSADNLATGASRTRMVILGERPFEPTSLQFPEEWAPRVGLTWDVTGNGKHKAYANYGKYVQRITQDLAYRAFSNEVDLSQNFLDAELTEPQFGQTCPVNTDGGVVNQPCQGIVAATGLGGPTVVWEGTKLPYTEEYLVGYSRELNKDFGFDLRYVHREAGRVLEDFSYVPQEAIANTLWGTGSTFFDATNSDIIVPFDPFPDYPQDFFGDYVLGNIGENTGDAIAELGGPGYPDFQSPKRDYDAVEFVLNKRFSDNWLMFASYRWSKLRGNYEGLLRNDNGQDDPNITSLYDFPDTPLMRGQFLEGPLNNDVTHNLKLYASYQFENGFDMGGALRWTSGRPRFTQLVHPNDFYQLPGNGEVPGTSPIYGQWVAVGGDPGNILLGLADGLNAGPTRFISGFDANNQPIYTDYTYNPAGGDTILVNDSTGTDRFLFTYTPIERDFMGRTPDTAVIDLHFGYKFKLGWRDSSIGIAADIFNVFDTQEAQNFDDVMELSMGSSNPNFLRPRTDGPVAAYQTPRQIRLGMTWQF